MIAALIWPSFGPPIFLSTIQRLAFQRDAGLTADRLGRGLIYSRVSKPMGAVVDITIVDGEREHDENKIDHQRSGYS